MRDDPIEGEPVELVVEASGGEESITALENALEAEGITVEERLEFGSVLVEVNEDDVADICDLSGIEAIETAATIGNDNDHHADM